MITISTKTAILVISSFAALCIAGVLMLSGLPRTSHWEHYRSTYPEKAIQANLREIVFAATDYMRYNDVSEARYKNMVGTSAFLKKAIEPVLGEDYDSICLRSQDTKLEVVTKHGTPVSITFRPLTGRSLPARPEPVVSDPNA